MAALLFIDNYGITAAMDSPEHGNRKKLNCGKKKKRIQTKEEKKKPLTGYY